MFRWLSRLTRFIPLSAQHRDLIMAAAREAIPDEDRFPDGPIYRESWSEVQVILGEGWGLCGEWQEVRLRWQVRRWVVVSCGYIIA
jgi:hypothetical protein